MNLETLYVEIKAQMSGFEKSVNSVKSQLSTLDKSTRKISTSIQKSMNSIRNSFTKLGKTLGKVISVVALVKLGKDALQAASDLEETQNVVNVAFGKSAAVIDDWSKRCLTAFGLTEYEAKTAAGSFKAMASSMGVADEAGTAMAMKLTELGGDLASFYNTTNNVAKTALNSIFTGETESLKKFGVVMSETNLKAYAMSQGITKAYSSMSQAEKVALRYKYVLSVTSAAQGDFARSANSWANQMKVLKGQWTSFLSVLGTALKQVLAPLLKTLNNILASLITTAKTIGALLGIDFSTTAATVSSVSDSAADASNSFEEANESAQKLNKTLAGFDELEVLSSKDSGSSSDASGGIGDLSSDITIDTGTVDVTPAEEHVTKSLGEILTSVDDWFNNTMAPWLKEKAGWLAEKINEAISATPWGQIGLTIADGLNGIIAALDEFYSTLNGYDLGLGISEMINKFVETFDAKTLGKTIGDKFKLVLDFLIGIIENLDTKGIGQAFADLFNNIDIVDIAAKIGKLLSDAVIAGLEILNAFLEGADATQISDAIEAFLNNIDFAGIKEQIGILIDNIIIKLVEVKTQIDETNGTLDKVIEALNRILILLGLIAALDIAGKIFIATGALEIFAGGLDGTLTIGEAFASSMSWVGQSIEEKFASALGVSVKNLGSLGTAISGLGSKIAAFATGPVGIAIAAIAAVVTALIVAYNTNDEFRARVDAFWNDTVKPFIEYIKQVSTMIWNEHLKPLWDSLKELLASLGELFKEFFASLWGLFKETLTAVAELVQPIIELISTVLLPIIKVIFDVVSVVISAIIGAIQGFVDWFKPIVDSMITIMKGITTFLTGVFTGDWKKAFEGLKQILSGFATYLGQVFKAPVNLVISMLNGMLSGIVKAINKIIDICNSLSFKIPDWIPGIGGETFGFNFKKVNAIQIAYLANGGVIDQPTLAMMGEYAGARNNPEIAVPQNTLEAIISSRNDDLIDAMAQMTRQVIGAVEDVDMSVTIGDDTIAQSAARGANNYKRRTGKALFAY